jgi:membrane protein
MIGSAPVQRMIDRSRKVFVPGFGNFSLYQVWRPFITQLKKSSLSERASAISFNVFMAIPPTLIFIFTLIPYLPISNRLIQQLFMLIRDIVPGENNNTVIINFLNDFLKQPRNDLLSFGLLLAVFFSSNAMMGILRAFDKNYIGFRKRNGIQKRRAALKLSLSIFILILSSLLILIAQGAVLKWMGLEIVWLRDLIHNSRWVIVVLLVFYSVSFIYRHGPALIVKWPFFTPGSVFATSLMILATVLVTFWVNNYSNFNKVYGSISVIFILMVLIFVNALVILIGFELNVTLASLNREHEAENIT